MKKQLLLILSLCLIGILQAQVSKTITISSAGSLNTILTKPELSTITNLTISGAINSNDIKTMRDSMPVLSYIDISNTVIQSKYIPMSAFQDKLTLHSIILPLTVTVIDMGAFMGCENLISVVLPPSLTKIDIDAFHNCQSLATVEIPPLVTTISWDAFNGCSGLTSLTIPTSVKKMGTGSFNNCTSLKSIFAYSIIPIDISQVDYNNIFLGVNKDSCVVYVPLNSKSAYQAAVEWKTFKNIIEGDGVWLPLSNVSIADTSINLSIVAKTTWTVSSDQAWLSVIPNTSVIGNGTITLTATANEIITPRIATITISGANAPTQTITVTQAAGDTIVSVSSKVANIGSIANSTSSVDIVSNTSWTASTNQLWLSVSPITATIGNASLTLRASANPTTEPRTAQVIVSAIGAKDTITVTQAAGDTALVISTKTITFTEKANIDSVFITSNAPWTASSDVAWLTLSPESGSGNDTLIITAQSNTTNSTRTATITIMSTSTSLLKSITEQTIIITQEAEIGTTINKINLNEHVISPNPAKSDFSINSEKNSIIEIYSTKGELVLSRHVINNELISINNLPTGLYFVKIISNNSILTQSLIIDKN